MKSGAIHSIIPAKAGIQAAFELAADARTHPTVIPAKAGIQRERESRVAHPGRAQVLPQRSVRGGEAVWIPAFAGMTNGDGLARVTAPEPRP